MLMNDKIMSDCYCCINSTKHCENNEENTGALYFTLEIPNFQKGHSFFRMCCFLFVLVNIFINQVIKLLNEETSSNGEESVENQ